MILLVAGSRQILALLKYVLASMFGRKLMYWKVKGLLSK